MKKEQYKDYVIIHNSRQDEILILGGKTELSDNEISEVADKDQIPEFEVRKSEVSKATKKGWRFQYFHYTLSYGPRSVFHSTNQDHKKEQLCN